jgi:hypothetical protein
MITDIKAVSVGVTDDDTNECFKLVVGNLGAFLHATQLCEFIAKCNEAYLEWMAKSLSGITPSPRYKPANNFPDLKVYVRGIGKIELLLLSYRIDIDPTVFAEFITLLNNALSIWINRNTAVVLAVAATGGLSRMLSKG